MDPTLSQLAPLDLVGAVLVSALLALGAWRGLWWQVIRLAGVVLAVVAARLFAERGALWIGENWPDLPLRAAHGISWVGFFLLALGASSLLGLLGQRLLEIMQLGLLNRVAGGLLGAATGFLLHVALLMGLCQLAPPNFVETHVAGTVSENVVDVVGSRWRVVLGAEAAAEVDRLLGSGFGEGSGAVR